jgi:hypothetical protein
MLPIGGIVDPGFGIMTHPGRWGISAGIKGGMPWAADNQAFTKCFNPVEYQEWLVKLADYRSTCLFVTIPDRVGDAAETLALFDRWYKHPMFAGWPLAFVAQDGQEDLPLPDSNHWGTLFIGGSTRWKLSSAAEELIARAQQIGKHIHVGRVNYWRRYIHFASLEGSHEWTCDGTRTRFGRDKALSDWARYMAAPHQPRLPVPSGDCAGEFSRDALGAVGIGDQRLCADRSRSDQS